MACNGEIDRKKELREEQAKLNEMIEEHKRKIDSLNKEENDLEKAFSISPEETEELIQGIRNELNRINSASLNKSTLNFTCDTDGTVTFYRQKGEIVKISIDWGFHGDYSSISEYYYNDGELIFIFQVSLGGPAGKPGERYEERTYIHNNQTIRFMQDKNIVACKYCIYGPESTEYKLANSSNKTVADILCE